jgi:hypothetical protein
VTLAVSQANLSLLCTQKFRFCDYPGNHPHMDIVAIGQVVLTPSGSTSSALEPLNMRAQRIRLRICIAKCLFF